MEPKREPPPGESEEKVAEKEEEEGRKRGGRAKRARGGHIPEAPKAAHHGRKHGGHVPGQKSKSRPDRRARGGGADMHPESSAGNMSAMDYERGRAPSRDEHGAGPDRNAKGEG